jgi:hypothetical protein
MLEMFLEDTNRTREQRRQTRAAEMEADAQLLK